MTFELGLAIWEARISNLRRVRLSALGAEVALDDVGCKDAPSRALAGTIDEVKIISRSCDGAVADSRAGADLRRLSSWPVPRLDVVAGGSRTNAPTSSSQARL